MLIYRFLRLVILVINPTFEVVRGGNHVTPPRRVVCLRLAASEKPD